MQTMTLLFWVSVIVLFRVDAGQCDSKVIRDMAEATYQAGEDESPRTAKQKAKDLALRRFVERVVGVHVRIEKLAENTHAIYSMVDVWAVANVRIDSVVYDRYADYTAHYRSHVSVARVKVDDLLRAFDEIAAAAVASKKMEIAERVRHQYAVIGEVNDMVLVPAYRDDPPFWIMRHPVSVWEYAQYNPNYRSDFRFDKQATDVSWKDARAYCRKKSMHLPTVIEWERAYTVADSISSVFFESVPDHEWVSILGSRRWYHGVFRMHPTKTIRDPWSVQYRYTAGSGWISFRCAQDAVLEP